MDMIVSYTLQAFLLDFYAICLSGLSNWGKRFEWIDSQLQLFAFSDRSAIRATNQSDLRIVFLNFKGLEKKTCNYVNTEIDL